jgi:hypothetical protein
MMLGAGCVRQPWLPSDAGRSDSLNRPVAEAHPGAEVERTQSLRVTIVDPDGRPVSGARVACEDKTVETDDDGVASLRSLPSRRMRVNAYAAGFAPPVPVEVVPRGQEITLRCRVGVVVRGRVITSAATPAAGAHVLILVGDERLQTTTGRDGRFEAIVPASRQSVGFVAIAGNERADVAQHRLEGGEPLLRLRPERVPVIRLPPRGE